MNNLLLNTVGCDLMIWEVNQKKRNENNEIKFVVPENQHVSVGDVIVCNYSAESISCYEVVEIVERRKSALTGKDYLIVKTRWFGEKPNFSDYNLVTNQTFNRLFDLN